MKAIEQFTREYQEMCQKYQDSPDIVAILTQSYLETVKKMMEIDLTSRPM